jgi:hypothetical protein
MLPSREVLFNDLPSSDLVVDAVYKGGSAANVSADPLQRLLPVGNSGGFRYNGRRSGSGISNCLLIALYSTEDEPNWPDHLDVETGLIHVLRRQPTSGPRASRHPARWKSTAPADVRRPARRNPRRIPPLFIFTTTGVGRETFGFEGSPRPAHRVCRHPDDLVAIWKTAGGSRFQNYRATFR